jgi:hypothetical protein
MERAAAITTGPEVKRQGCFFHNFIIPFTLHITERKFIFNTLIFLKAHGIISSIDY